MATKKELEERIAALEAEIALLRARPAQVVLPATYPVWPHYDPYRYPIVWCSGTSTGQKNTIAINAVN